MKASSLNSEQHLNRSERAGLLDGVARKLVLGGQLNRLTRGRLVIRENQQEYTFGQVQGSDELTATITVNSPRFYGDLAFGGSIGAGEAWMQGYWDCDNRSGHSPCWQSDSWGIGRRLPITREAWVRNWHAARSGS